MAAVLGGIFIGIWDPTEAAAIGAFAGILLALAYRRLTIANLKEALLVSVKLTSMLVLIMLGAQILTFVAQYTGVTKPVVTAMLSLSSDRWVVMVAIMGIYMILGCFFEAFAMMLLTLPFVFPVVIALGYSPVWFGVVLVICIEAGMLTPPVGMNLFVVHTIARGKYSLGTIAIGSVPFLLCMFFVLAVLMIFPNVALWLPSLM